MPDSILSGTVGKIGKGWSQSSSSGVDRPFLLDYSGAQVMMDFNLKSMLDGHAYQVRAGTITTPLVGNVPLADTVAEYCIDPPAGYTALPVAQIISIRLGTGTLHEYASKSVSTASSAGTAFVPLPLLWGGTASATTARVAAHAVTVTAELATTTTRHWSFSQPIAMGAYDARCVWEPRTPPVIRSTAGAAANAKCFYTQVAATGTGPSYYANLDFLEFISTQLGLG